MLLQINSHEHLASLEFADHDPTQRECKRGSANFDHLIEFVVPIAVAVVLLLHLLLFEVAWPFPNQTLEKPASVLFLNY